MAIIFPYCHSTPQFWAWVLLRHASGRRAGEKTQSWLWPFYIKAVNGVIQFLEEEDLLTICVLSFPKDAE